MNALLRGVAVICQKCKKDFCETIMVKGNGKLLPKLLLAIKVYLSQPHQCRECINRTANPWLYANRKNYKNGKARN